MLLLVYSFVFSLNFFGGISYSILKIFFPDFIEIVIKDGRDFPGDMRVEHEYLFSFGIGVAGVVINDVHENPAADQYC